jgi:hypothetical protein
VPFAPGGDAGGGPAGGAALLDVLPRVEPAIAAHVRALLCVLGEQQATAALGEQQAVAVGEQQAAAARVAGGGSGRAAGGGGGAGRAAAVAYVRSFCQATKGRGGIFAKQSHAQVESCAGAGEAKS